MSNSQSDAPLNWRGNAPVSDRFDDVYYSAENGLAETRFVFLNGIGAPECWKDARQYVICETGFGTGLNFLATWKAWVDSGAKGQLIFISVEGYPLSEKALEEAHRTFPKLAPYAEQLRRAWPPNAKGYHPRHFEGGKVSLILMFGDAHETLSNLTAIVDAWYLDGFAPSKNPEMWSDRILDQIVRLSKPGTRFATFTAAGFVKRGLQGRGFDVQKTPGYGRKRERLVGIMNTKVEANTQQRTPEWASLTNARKGPVTVVGAGIAGASVANALKRRGRDVRIIAHPHQLAASQVPAAILSPRFLLEENAAARFFTSAYAHSCWMPEFNEAWTCDKGITLLPKNDPEISRLVRIAEKLDWTGDWLQYDNDSLYLPRGGSLNTALALAELTKSIPIEKFEIASISQAGEEWILKSIDGNTIVSPNVVIASGIGSLDYISEPDCPELRPNRGQIETLRPPYPAWLPKHSIGFGGYVTAETDNSRTIGSTFDRLEKIDPTSYSTSDNDQNRILDMATAIFGKRIDRNLIVNSWTGVRATTADHLPFAGPLANRNEAAKQYAALAKDAKTSGLGAPPLHDGLYMLSGLGSKGFQYGPILGEYLAAQICGSPLPLPSDLIPKLHPLRDLIRSIKRKKN